MDRLLFLFHTDHPKDTYIQLHQHECYELVYYLNGNGTTMIGSTQYSFKPNTFAFIAPRTLHDERHLTGSELLFIGFHCEQDGAIRHLNQVFEDDEKHTIRQLMFRMEHEFTEQQENFFEMLNLLVTELTTQIHRLVGLNKHIRPGGGRLKYAMNFMDEHFRQRVSIETLARMSGYSYDRFRHLFKETAGVSPQQYLQNKRLEYAKSLLLHSQLPISVISQKSGFSKDSQFCTIFKRETGLTPLKFRKTPAG
ncbi:helix-turn-helix domain-containing protein [Paenibacillus sp. HN-1]|uniref:helix-turn-helix transcriptional regulator n=1 Tax=Paenibacillus TaxID=44249 RepID=UPI001CA85656|nr:MULTISPECIES: AraC family transcriptional regulator [Paenibacillus]MBY9077315.1 helix-turn-helix domain-containing protein [Paenibacillus sp. CGMCC 1.18879]MBY9085635.1 helix-turn-helix domain-containing protein [Paenibacillus sinensis]